MRFTVIILTLLLLFIICKTGIDKFSQNKSELDTVIEQIKPYEFDFLTSHYDTVYNMSDIIRDWALKPEARKVNIGGRVKWCKDKDYLLGCKYVNKHGVGKYTIDKMVNLIKNTKLKDKTDILNVHLRIGDVIWIGKKDPKSWEARYYNEPDFYKTLNIPDKVKKISIFAGTHRKDEGFNTYQKLKPSAEHILKIKDIFEKRGYAVTLKLGGHPDKAFEEMGNSKYFLKSSRQHGGFTNMIADLVTANGGNVIG